MITGSGSFSAWKRLRTWNCASWLLEALDEMGISPAAIAGGLWAPLSAARRPRESTGGLFATHLLRVLSNRPDVMSELLRARVGRFADLVLLGRGNPVPASARDLS
jgi:NTE family protein